MDILKESEFTDLLEFLHLTQTKEDTCFSSVWVYPEIDENIEVDINPKDIRIDTMSIRAGGQHINATDSAVKYTS